MLIWARTIFHKQVYGRLRFFRRTLPALLLCICSCVKRRLAEATRVSVVVSLVATQDSVVVSLVANRVSVVVSPVTTQTSVVVSLVTTRTSVVVSLVTT